MQTSDVVLVNPHLPVQSHKQFELWEVGIKLTALLNTLQALQICHTIINIVILVYINFCEEFNTQVQVSYTSNLSDMILKAFNVVMLVTAGSQYHAHIIYIYVYDLYRYSVLHVQLHCFSNYHHRTAEKNISHNHHLVILRSTKWNLKKCHTLFQDHTSLHDLKTCCHCHSHLISLQFSTWWITGKALVHPWKA